MAQASVSLAEAHEATTKLSADVPPVMERVVAKCLAKDPQNVMSAGGEWMIYTRATRVNGWNDAQIVALSTTSDEERILVEVGHDGRWVPGYLTYVHDGVLFAVPFDAEALRVTGDPVLLAEGLGLSEAAMTRSGILRRLDDRRAGVLLRGRDRRSADDVD